MGPLSRDLDPELILMAVCEVKTQASSFNICMARQATPVGYDHISNPFGIGWGSMLVELVKGLR